MVNSTVPQTVEEMYERYDRFISWKIRGTRCVREDEVEEFRQQVYLRVLEQRFLDRCREYYTTHPGKFISSLGRLVRNVVYKRAERGRTDPMAKAAGLPEVRVRGFTTSERPIPKAAQVRSHERAIEARDVLAQIARRLDSPKRRTRIAAVLDAAVEHGLHSGHLAQVLDANPSTIRFYLVNIRAEARRLETACTATTKFARRSARPVSASRSSSGRGTDSPTV